MKPLATAETPYSPGGFFLGDTSSDIKTKVIAGLISRFAKGFQPQRILVIGCGDGNDAVELAKHFDCRVNAIDVEDYFDRRNSTQVDFERMDARDLRFTSATFDLAYSFHALEHIPEPIRALREVRRVLRPGGLYCIGTPNRLRLVGYIGVADYPLASKVRSNLRDWGDRLLGRFKNELGAHAGFSSSELTSLCAIIGTTRDISNDYYNDLYATRAGLMTLIVKLGLAPIAWPSVYIFGQRDSLQ